MADAAGLPGAPAGARHALRTSHGPARAVAAKPGGTAGRRSAPAVRREMNATPGARGGASVTDAARPPPPGDQEPMSSVSWNVTSTSPARTRFVARARTESRSVPRAAAVRSRTNSDAVA